MGEDTYSELIGGCVRAGDMPRGISWFREMRKANLRPGPELNRLMLQAPGPPSSLPMKNRRQVGGLP